MLTVCIKLFRLRHC